MPETARLLQFPIRSRGESLSAAEALEIAEGYLSLGPEREPLDASSRILKHPEAVLALLSLFKDLVEASPSTVADEAATLYSQLQSCTDGLWLFDEKDYMLGEAARYCAWAGRLCGRYDEAERWLDRAEAAYRHTVNPAPLLANASYARLAVRYETHRYADVLDLIPSLISSFEKLGMSAEASKARYLEAVSLKGAGRAMEAFEAYTRLRSDLRGADSESLLGQVLVQMGGSCGARGDFDEALGLFAEALPLIKRGGRPIVLAELKWNIGETYRAQGNLAVALEAYREARADYRALGMGVFESLVGLSIADTLLTMERPREAEWEILSALPAIESASLGPEILAAAALLRESARQKKTNPEALKELRELLATKH